MDVTILKNKFVTTSMSFNFKLEIQSSTHPHVAHFFPPCGAKYQICSFPYNGYQVWLQFWLIG